MTTTAPLKSAFVYHKLINQCDGPWFACNYQNKAGASYHIAIVPFEGGQPVKMFDIRSFGPAIHWTVDGRDLTYVDTKGGVSNIWGQGLATVSDNELYGV